MAAHPVTALRKRDDLTIHELAAKAKVSVGAISQLESGATRNPNRATIGALAASFGLTRTELELRLARHRVAEAEEQATAAEASA